MWIKNQNKILNHLTNQNLFVIFDSLWRIKFSRIKMNRFGPSPDSYIYSEIFQKATNLVFDLKVTYEVSDMIAIIMKIFCYIYSEFSIFNCKRKGFNYRKFLKSGKSKRDLVFEKIIEKPGNNELVKKYMPKCC